MSWSAQQYTLFERERTRPVHDLVAAIPNGEAQRAVDLGCGPGNSTEVLLQRFPLAHISGTDNAEDMLEAARRRLPAVTFERSDIATWNPASRYDVILANASLQWLPDHATLYPHLVSKLTEGGTLAVQTPDNLEEPAHRLARDVAAHGPWQDKIGAVQHPQRHDARFYFTLLRPLCRQVDLWRTTYFHVLQGGPSAIVAWFKSTALRPFLGPLSEDEQNAFLRAYTEAIAQAYPAEADGTVLLPFPRLFLVATR